MVSKGPFRRPYKSRLENPKFIAKRIAQFWAKVDQTGGPDACWPWLGSLFKQTGYGQCHFLGKKDNAHRVAFFLTNGSIPTGLYVLHDCDNRPCCNPNHLKAGTQRQNIHDGIGRGRPIGSGHKHCGSASVRAKMTEDGVAAMRAEYATGSTQRELAEKYGIQPVTVSDIIRRKTWRHVH